MASRRVSDALASFSSGATGFFFFSFCAGFAPSFARAVRTCAWNARSVRAKPCCFRNSAMTSSSVDSSCS
jgi:hypothetical protein